jgi:hypothetical protein
MYDYDDEYGSKCPHSCSNCLKIEKAAERDLEDESKRMDKIREEFFKKFPTLRFTSMQGTSKLFVTTKLTSKGKPRKIRHLKGVPDTFMGCEIKYECVYRKWNEGFYYKGYHRPSEPCPREEQEKFESDWNKKYHTNR